MNQETPQEQWERLQREFQEGVHASYPNPDRRGCPGTGVLEDQSEEEIERLILDDTGDKEWKFYFTSGEPPESVRREVEASLG